MSQELVTGQSGIKHPDASVTLNPTLDRDPFVPRVLLPEKLDEIQARMDALDPSGIAPMLVLDVDEFLLNSVMRHWELTNASLLHRAQAAEKKANRGSRNGHGNGHLKPSQDIEQSGCTALSVAQLESGPYRLPTYEEVCAAGGTHNAYKDYPDYWVINEQLRHARGFNLGLPLVDQRAPHILRDLQERGIIPAAYLTTRPTHIEALTRASLVRNGYPDMTVVARDDDTASFEMTTAWKIAELKALAAAAGRRVIMIDDSTSIAHDLDQERREAQQHGNPFPPIGIVTFLGPMTDPGRIPPGVLSSDWPGMPDAILRELERLPHN